jgi:hypothetical protein
VMDAVGCACLRVRCCSICAAVCSCRFGNVRKRPLDSALEYLSLLGTKINLWSAKICKYHPNHLCAGVSRGESWSVLRDNDLAIHEESEESSSLQVLTNRQIRFVAKACRSHSRNGTGRRTTVHYLPKVSGVSFTSWNENKFMERLSSQSLVRRGESWSVRRALNGNT